MSDSINATIHAPSLKATLPTGASVGAQLAPEANIGGQLTPGGIIMNDYRIALEQTEAGGRITVTRGAEKQQMDIHHGANVVDIEIEEVV